MGRTHGDESQAPAASKIGDGISLEARWAVLQPGQGAALALARGGQQPEWMRRGCAALIEGAFVRGERRRERARRRGRSFAPEDGEERGGGVLVNIALPEPRSGPQVGTEG